MKTEKVTMIERVSIGRENELTPLSAAKRKSNKRNKNPIKYITSHPPVISRTKRKRIESKHTGYRQTIDTREIVGKYYD